MSHYVTRSLFDFYIYEFGRINKCSNSLETIIPNVNDRIILTKTDTVPIEYYHSVLKVFHDIDYQSRYEIDSLKSIFLSSDVHSAMLSNCISFTDLIRCISDMGKRNVSSSLINYIVDCKYTTIYLDVVEDRTPFYSPQSFFFILGYHAKKIFDMNLSEHEVVIGVKQQYIPDEEKVLTQITSRLRTNQSRSYIRIPNYIMEIKNSRYNELLNDFINLKYLELYKTSCDNFIDRVICMISSYWLENGMPPSVDFVSESLNISRVTFYRNLKERGVTYKWLVDEERRKMSLSLLKQNTLSVSEISDVLGYSNVSSFSRTFKRWFNTSPSEIKK